MKNRLSKSFRSIDLQKFSAGFTLVELLVAMAITGVVISAAGFGLVTIMGADKKAQAETARRIELNRGLDFIAEEIRMARRVNTTEALELAATTGTSPTTTAALAVTNSGLSLPTAAGTAVLYLEIPVGSCSGTQVIDKVVYDIRSSSGTNWLAPRIVNRYGRIPANNGTVDPCSSPVSKALVDSISDTGNAPQCDSPAILSGTEGFYACVNRRQVNLALIGRVVGPYGNTEVYNTLGTIFVRGGVSSFSSSPSPTPSSSPSPLCTQIVPNVIGMSAPGAANTAITNAGLAPAGFADLTNHTKGQVQTQSPTSGSLPCGGTVTYHYRPN